MIDCIKRVGQPVFRKTTNPNLTNLVKACLCYNAKDRISCEEIYRRVVTNPPNYDDELRDN